MADEPILYSNLTTDARVAAAVSSRFLQLFSGRAALPQHVALAYDGPIDNIKASKTKRVPHYRLNGADLFEQVAEGTAVETTNIDTGHSDVTVDRFVLARNVGDLARMTDPNDVLNMTVLGDDAFSGYTGTLVNLACDVIDGFTATGGQSGAPASFSDFFDALASLASIPGRKLAILHTDQWNEIQKGIAFEASGAMQYVPATQELILQNGPGFQGSIGQCDIFTSDLVKTDSGDYKGAIMAHSAVCWADGIPTVDDPVNQQLIGGKVLWERDRHPKEGTTDWVATGWLGVAKGVDANGVTFISKIPA